MSTAMMTNNVLKHADQFLCDQLRLVNWTRPEVPAIPPDSPHVRRILSHVCRNAHNATVRTRGAVFYAGSISDADKQKFLDKLHESLMEYTTKPTSEEIHFQNVETLAREMFSSFPVNVMPGRSRIGCAQKALNLWLKHLWCLGWHPEPWHCPFDAGVLVAAKYNGTAWTKVEAMGDYRKMVRCASIVAGKKGQSLSEWELCFWQENVAPSAGEG